ncbi:4'-phosphopantetheinyl transferase family protein [Larkinella terrae]|uniref:4'-phosphopantetheinyl transferase superfamily protein n=1 Tax=Larkinella terrae TaxID=2025311 RepID=A0A7K0EUU4_9BACT|nr:4'-phosphopantetheinyl transferase superfamily protein [Larkinella terrae]MRS65580.1 4'-phosphopantetheinyl transferase superfamily protein [Larkinella terrae]
MGSAFLVYNTLPAVKWSDVPESLPVSDLAIFRIELIRFSGFINPLSALLMPDEQIRAQRYFHEKDRHRFIITRGLLRILLGNYTGRKPADIRFVQSVHKKPSVLGSDWHYNVSHSGGWALIALSKTAVGIDIEKIDRDFQFRDILSESFTPQERVFIEQSPDPRARFYQLWTRKEALVKATGRGIDEHFKQIPSQEGTHTVDNQQIGSSDRWIISSFDVTEEYAAAVAYESPERVADFYELRYMLNAEP